MASATQPIKAQPKSRPEKKPARSKAARGRVLIEFPAADLSKTDKAARAEGVSRSEFIRAAVQQRLQAIAEAEFERELEESYKANADFNRKIMKEFEHVDREAWNLIP